MIQEIDYKSIDKKALYETIKDAFFDTTFDSIINRLNIWVKSGMSIFCILDNNIIIGSVGVIDTNDCILINYIGVLKGNRKIGIGKNLIMHIKNRYNKNIFAETDKESMNFYKAIGFECTEKMKEYNGKKVVRYSCELKMMRIDKS